VQYQGKPTILRLPHKLYTHRQSRKNEKLTEWNIAGRSTKRATIELQEGRSGEYWIHGGSFIGGGGCGHRSTAEEAADYMSQSPHWSVLMRLTKELGWEDVHRYLGMTKYGFVPMSLPIPQS
jgi:hypothetical protein